MGSNEIISCHLDNLGNYQFVVMWRYLLPSSTIIVNSPFNINSVLENYICLIFKSYLPQTGEAFHYRMLKIIY
jgi:hypothetical protein